MCIIAANPQARRKSFRHGILISFKSGQSEAETGLVIKDTAGFHSKMKKEREKFEDAV